MFSVKIKKNTIPKNFKRYKKLYPVELKKSMGKAGLQMLNWTINGSPNLPLRPPVLTGRLRGSGSVFVGSKFIADTNKDGKGTPNTSYQAGEFQITIGFNTPYARRMHEIPFKPGPVSQQSGDVGNKFLTRHLEADKALMMQFIAKLMKKEMSKK